MSTIFAKVKRNGPTTEAALDALLVARQWGYADDTRRMTVMAADGVTLRRFWDSTRLADETLNYGSALIGTIGITGITPDGGSSGDSATLQAMLKGMGAAIVAGAGSYINNTTVQQASSNFNISGAGVIGTTLAVAGTTAMSNTLTITNAQASAVLVSTTAGNPAVITLTANGSSASIAKEGSSGTDFFTNGTANALQLASLVAVQIGISGGGAMVASFTSGGTALTGTLSVSGVSTMTGNIVATGRILINGAVDAANWGVISASKKIAVTGTQALQAYGVGSPDAANNEYIYVAHSGAGGGEISVTKDNAGTFRDMTLLTSDTVRYRISAAGAHTLTGAVAMSSTLAVTGVSTLTGNILAAGRILINGAVDESGHGIISTSKHISLTASRAFRAYGLASPDIANTEYIYMGHFGASGGYIAVTKEGSGSFRDFIVQTSDTDRYKITAAGAHTLTGAVTCTSTLAVNGTLAVTSTSAFSNTITLTSAQGNIAVVSTTAGNPAFIQFTANSAMATISKAGTGGGDFITSGGTAGSLQLNTHTNVPVQIAVNNTRVANFTAAATELTGTLTISGLSSGRIPVVSTSGLLIQDNLYWSAADDRLGIGADSSTPAHALHVAKTDAGNFVTACVSNADNTNAASHARLRMVTGGASGGDPLVSFTNGVVDWSMGLDNSTSDSFKISMSTALGTSDAFTIGTDLKITVASEINCAATPFYIKATTNGANLSIETNSADVILRPDGTETFRARDNNGILVTGETETTTLKVTGSVTGALVCASTVSSAGIFTASTGISVPDGYGILSTISATPRNMISRSGTTYAIGDSAGWTGMTNTVASGTFAWSVGATQVMTLGTAAGLITEFAISAASIALGSVPNKFTVSGSGATVIASTLSIAGVLTYASGIATTAGGAQIATFGSGAEAGIYWGSGAPSVSAPQGALYLRTDGSGVDNRAYIRASGSWTALSTLA